MKNPTVRVNSFELKRETWGVKKGEYTCEIALSVDGHSLHYKLPRDIGDKIIDLCGAELFKASLEVADTISNVFSSITGNKPMVAEDLKVLKEHEEVGAAL